MDKAQFEEKEYECAANLEIALEYSDCCCGKGHKVITSSASVYSPGQVTEGLLGFDAAGNPQHQHDIWKVLHKERPRGVFVNPSTWPSVEAIPDAMRVPSIPFSLFVQYKRPYYLSDARNKLWKGQPFYRFKIEEGQCQILQDLAAKVDDRAFVLYAAPAFWRYVDLEVAKAGRRILAQTGFVPPDRVAGHKFWTYTEAGVCGIPNPDDGSSYTFNTFDQIKEIAMNHAQDGLDLADHLELLANVFGELDPELSAAVEEWVQGTVIPGILDTDVPVPAEWAASFLGEHGRSRQISNAILINSIAAARGLTWSMIETDRRNTI
jgi:hypothetical protein